MCKMDAESSLKFVSNDNENGEQPFASSNEDCMIVYNLWAKGSNFSFAINNTTTRNLYVYLPECFLISNGIAYDYYKDAEYGVSNTDYEEEGVGVGWGVGLATSVSYHYPQYWGVAYGAGVSANAKAIAKAGSASQTSVRVKVPKVICIPPHSSRSIYCPYTLGLLKDCDYNMFPKAKSESVQFSEASSPCVVENCIAYGYNAEGKDLKRLTHKFWVSQVTNYSSKEITEKVEIEDCFHKGFGYANLTAKEVHFKFSSPCAFYNTYTDKSISLWRLKAVNTSKSKKQYSKGGNNRDEDSWSW